MAGFLLGRGVFEHRPESRKERLEPIASQQFEAMATAAPCTALESRISAVLVFVLAQRSIPPRTL